MSGYPNDEDAYSFGRDPQFQSFDYGGGGGVGYGAPPPQQVYGGGSYSRAPQYDASYSHAPQQHMYQPGASGFEDERPLLEELGINVDHIIQKTLAVLNPAKRTDAQILQDTDMAGPLIFCLAFGGFLLLCGKVHFGYIYGIGVMGCLGMYFLLNMMSVPGVSVGVTVSVLGYCLLPMVGLAGISAVVSLKGLLGILGTLLAISWCAVSASKLFVTALELEHQQPLIAYPCGLLYGIFALLTVF